MIGLTARQSECLTFLKEWIATNGVPPSTDEISLGLGLKSKSGVTRLLDGLVERGAIRRIRNRARAIEIIDPETMQAVLLNPEIYGLVRAYAGAEHVGIDTAANELLRQVLGAAA